MRVPSGEPELVRAGAAGDPATAALWDAYGARVFAFCQRLLGSPEAAADAAQDAFLLAHAQLGSLEASGKSFGVALFGAARTTCYELLAREGRRAAGRRGAAPSLSAAAARLRPQQRAALALTGLEGLRYAEVATVLAIGTEGVGALLARARLRLHDELHGTALAGAAVRSPACEDVVALLAAASDGELDAADAGWADPHVEHCPTCPRTRRAMDETAATYAAWSPAIPPSWLKEATLAELGAEAPAGLALAPAAAAAAAAAPSGRGPRRAASMSPRPGLSAALLGATLLCAAFAALLLATTGALRQRDPLAGGVALPDGSRSLEVAGVPAAPAARRAARRRAPRPAHRARRAHRTRRVAFVAVRHVTSAPRPGATSSPAGPRPRRAAPRPRRTPSRRPAPAAPAAPAPAPAPAQGAPAPVSADAPADELPGFGDGSTTAAAPATTAQVPAAVAPPKTTTTIAPPAAAAPVAASAPSAVDARGQDRDGGGSWHKSTRPCPPAPHCQHGSCRR